MPSQLANASQLETWNIEAALHYPFLGDQFFKSAATIILHRLFQSLLVQTLKFVYYSTLYVKLHMNDDVYIGFMR